MKVLIACEFSGIVRDAFTASGHDATSCDLLPTEKPGRHYMGDVRDILNDGWDLMIAHPPCTFLSYAGNVWINQPGRKEKREQALNFFLLLAKCNIRKIAVENPVGYPQKVWRKPDQIIHPFQFGHEGIRKATCLWLKELPALKYADIKMPPAMRIDGVTGRNRNWTDIHPGGNNEKRRKNRSRTFEGIAAAMAEQWGNN